MAGLKGFQGPPARLADPGAAPGAAGGGEAAARPPLADGVSAGVPGAPSLPQAPHRVPDRSRAAQSGGPSAPAAGPAAAVRHHCGVFAVQGHEDPVHLTYLALHALQHRGQEAAGIAAADGRAVQVRRGTGLVSEALPAAELAEMAAARPRAAVGHCRYSTTGASNRVNAQPLAFDTRLGRVAIAHNGNFTNALFLRMECEAQGSIFWTGTDTEVVAHLMARSGAAGTEEALLEALDRLEGAYALAVLTPDRMWLCRDPHGIRPLVLGRLGAAWVAASETCALDAIEATFVREVHPGEVLELGPHGPRTVREQPAAATHLCLFELIYLARPDSVLQGANEHLVRKEMGRRLARAAPAEADIVVGVPDSGRTAGIGYAEEAGLPYEEGLVKNRYVGRTFIQPSQAMRELGVRIKLNAMPAVVSGRRVVLVEDSIVRGTTARHLVGLVRRAGARAVHLRVASPPFLHPCYYGIDIPSREELLAPGRSVAEMARAVGADSLAFLEEGEALQAAAAAAAHGGFCTACFSGRYPVPVVDAAPELAAQREAKGV